MPSAEVQLAYQTFEAFRSRDMDAFVALVHEDVEFMPLMRDAEGQALYRGHKAIRAYYRSLFETFPDYTADIEATEQIDDATLILRAHVTGTGAGSGLPLDVHVWVASRLRGDKVAWWGFFRSRDEALAALAS